MRFRRFLTWLWAVVVLSVLLFIWRDETLRDPTRLAALLETHGSWVLPGFVAFALVRGALLVPSTWAVVGGAALYPHALPFVFVVTMAGIVLSAALLYRFPGFAGYDQVLAAKYPKQLERLQRELVRPRAIWLVAGWAAFPLVPTDLICYAAGLVRMPYGRMILGIIIGELPLVTAYILLGAGLLQRLPF